MIPNYPVKILKNVTLEEIRWPPTKVLTYEDGLMANHEYADERGHSWEDFLKAYALEKTLVERAGKEARNADHFEEILEKLQEELFSKGNEDLWNFELGVSSVSLAVSAFGGAPVSSCRHHPRRSNEEQPYVAFWIKRRSIKKLVELSEKVPIGLTNYDIEGYTGLIAWAGNIVDLMTFGNAIYLAQLQK